MEAGTVTYCLIWGKNIKGENSRKVGVCMYVCMMSSITISIYFNPRFILFFYIMNHQSLKVFFSFMKVKSNLDQQFWYQDPSYIYIKISQLIFKMISLNQFLPDFSPSCGPFFWLNSFNVWTFWFLDLHVLNFVDWSIFVWFFLISWFDLFPEQRLP